MSPTVDYTKVKYVEVFPAIGVSRLGNSDAEPANDHFIGPEIPLKVDIPEGGFKDSNGKIKRQAARFRAYAYDADGNILGEVNESNGYSLNWTASVTNSKAAYHRFHGKFRSSTGLRNPTVQPDLPIDERDKLIIKATRSVEGVKKTSLPLEGEFYGSRQSAVAVYLGELRTDESGRLVFLGGRGHSRSTLNPLSPYPMITSEFDAADWVDDASDGSITVKVKHKASQTVLPEPLYPAWVLCAPPRFGWGAKAPTSLFDVIEEVYEQPKRLVNGSTYKVPDPVFYKDVWPLVTCTWYVSWLNDFGKAGHGANVDDLVRGYNFFEKEALLSSTAITSLRERQKVFKFIRVPVKPKYQKYREAQASAKFMPRISGDGGDIPESPDDPTRDLVNRFSSLTELQYDRLHKWSLGKFSKGEKKDPPATFEEIPIAEQPYALTYAALEWTIGSPLFPGIEMYWKAEELEWYNFDPAIGPKKLDPPFRINTDNVKPGDLTENLSMPWQSDFYLCNTHWWPSLRPDSVVTDEYYQSIVNNVAPADLAKKLTGRSQWDRGLREDVTNEEGLPFEGNYDMVRNWDRLAFVAPVPYDQQLAKERPILVEGTRGQIINPDPDT